MIKIAIIPPLINSDFLTDTVIDGILDLSLSGAEIDFKILETYSGPFEQELNGHFLSTKDFIEYSIQEADIIFLCFRYKELNSKIADTINQWHKTVFVDGSEYKHDNRFDFSIQYDVLNNKYSGPGAPNIDIYKKAGLYLRREKPYLGSMIPFPFGIERRYKKYHPSIQKDIDFVCIFGQEMYPKMRMYCKKIIEEFCKKHNLICKTEKSDGFTHDLKKIAGRNDFYEILSQSKIGISVGGGGFDTLRFWEILANNCILLTERIDIYPIDNNALKYKRIHEFNNLFDFENQLENMLPLLRGVYSQATLEEEYAQIIRDHSTKSRIIQVLEEAETRGIIETKKDWNIFR